MEKVNCFIFQKLKENLWESNNELLLKIYIATINGFGLVEMKDNHVVNFGPFWQNTSVEVLGHQSCDGCDGEADTTETTLNCCFHFHLVF